jgi:hypothetical protein
VPSSKAVPCKGGKAAGEGACGVLTAFKGSCDPGWLQ